MSSLAEYSVLSHKRCLDISSGALLVDPIPKQLALRIFALCRLVYGFLCEKVSLPLLLLLLLLLVPPIRAVFRFSLLSSVILVAQAPTTLLGSAYPLTFLILEDMDKRLTALKSS